MSSFRPLEYFRRGDHKEEGVTDVACRCLPLSMLLECVLRGKTPHVVYSGVSTSCSVRGGPSHECECGGVSVFAPPLVRPERDDGASVGTATGPNRGHVLARFLPGVHKACLRSHDTLGDVLLVGI